MQDNNSKEPLLLSSPREADKPDEESQEYLLGRSNISFASSFVADADDIPPINGVRDFFREFTIESKKLWYLAGPAIFTSICQYSLGAITQTLAGHLGTLELAAVSIENSVIAGLSFGIMVTYVNTTDSVESLSNVWSREVPKLTCKKWIILKEVYVSFRFDMNTSYSIN